MVRLRICAVLLFLSVIITAAATYTSVRTISLDTKISAIQYTDRHGEPLNITYQGAWNTHDLAGFHQIPSFLKNAFIVSEDRRFYTHAGIDWRARSGALWQNLRYGRTIRGASTITEQVVRMVNPRPRTLWSKYLEGIEAAALERRYSKSDIFEFYLNQVPYASNRRGVVQGARTYFDRDIHTMTEREMMTLVVMARAPSAYDLKRHPGRIDGAIDRLAESMKDGGYIDERQYERLLKQKIHTTLVSEPLEARHFMQYIQAHIPLQKNRVRTTLDGEVQRMVQDVLDQRVAALDRKKVENGAAIVIDHVTGDILAWVVAGAHDPETAAGDIDAVTTPRQPGSALKPFLYARALDKGWSASTVLNDSPLSEAVGNGLHRFRNYSRTYYGEISLRKALGNSLNIPALLTIRHVGIADYLTILHQLGFKSLDKGSDFYDEGLALGNGEVTLLELASAYATLANQGVSRPLVTVTENPQPQAHVRVYSNESASLIGNILSDPWARRQEFGRGSVLNLPVQTAVKTGTSTDYRDAWVVGYDSRYVVGIWMGNLDHTPMDGVTGSTGPALALRSIFSRLNQDGDTAKLYISPKLMFQDICIQQKENCALRSEWEMPGTASTAVIKKLSKSVELIRPTEGLQLAYDPRVPQAHQNFRFELGNLPADATVVWTLDGREVGKVEKNTYLWPVSRGTHALQVTIYAGDGAVHAIPEVSFIVK